MTVADVTDAVIGWLRADTALVAELGTDRQIGDRLPAAMSSRAFVAVTRSGGGPALLRGRVREPRLQVDVWGPSSEQTGRSDAVQAAEQARRAVEDLTGQITGGLQFASVDVLGDLLYLPDTSFLPQRPRYVFEFRAIVHPHP